MERSGGREVKEEVDRGGSKCKEWEGSREGIETGMGSYMEGRGCLGAGKMHDGVQED